MSINLETGEKTFSCLIRSKLAGTKGVSLFIRMCDCFFSASENPEGFRVPWRRSVLTFPRLVPARVLADKLRERAFLRFSSVPPAAAAVLCYLSIYLAAAVKWLSDKLECNDNDRDG